MGEIWAKAFHDQGGTIKGIIDIDDSVEELAQSVDSNHYSPSEIDSIEADIWCIAVPTQFHHTYLQKAVKKGIERVIVEKPSTISPKFSSRATAATGIAVDYVELKNNVVKAVFERIQAETFDPTRLIHWRGKTSIHVHPFMRNDLVHDLSEIYGLYDILEYDFSDISPKHTLDIEGWSNEERPPRESGF